MSRIFHAIVLSMISLQPAAAQEVEAVAASETAACALTVGDAQESCSEFAYMVTSDGVARLFVEGNPNVIGFVGTSKEEPLQAEFRYAVRLIQRKVGDDSESFEATGECEVTLSESTTRLSSIRCDSDSDLGSVTLDLKAEGAEVRGH